MDLSFKRLISLDMFNALEIRTVVADVRVVGTVWILVVYAYVSSSVEELFKKYELFTVSCCFTSFIPETFYVLFKSIGYGFYSINVSS